MFFYNFEQIKEAARLTDVARNVLGLKLSADNRSAATWRGGDNPTSISYDDQLGKWYDHATGEHGDVIDLVKNAKGFHETFEAAAFLAEHYGIKQQAPDLREPPGESFYDKKIAEGYVETVRYLYTDEVGNLAHLVARLEHPAKKKVFVQGANNRWGVKGVQLYPYNLPAVIASHYAIVCEGEKAAQCLIDLGLPATTNVSGAGKWLADYSQYFRGKQVFILPDNDDEGAKHAKQVAKSLLPVAGSVKIVPTSKAPKGDAFDYIAEGNTIDDLSALCAAAPVVTESELEDVTEVTAQIHAAKEANKYEFRNYWNEKRESGGKVVYDKQPLHINRLIQECHTRFLGFPRKVGEQLFDHDKKTHELYFIRKQTTLFAWIARKSKQRVDWKKGDNFCGKEEFYEGLHAEATRYQSISLVPDYPKRDDVYYAHKPLPQPSKEHKYFNQFCDFFSPTSGSFRTALKAFVMAPLYYEPGIPRPLWIIDSDRPGSGKTMLANLVARLYGKPPIEVKKRDFARDMEKVTKRMVSETGRLARMFLVDNVTGTFASEELAGLITMPDISGMAPYGHGEETRPNNLTYVITANNASIDNDLAIRAFFIRLGEIEYTSSWNRDVQEFIAKHRYDVFADMLDMLNAHQSAPRFETAPCTRCPEFEQQILQAVCADLDEYEAVVREMLASRQTANIEDEWGREIEDAFRYELRESGVNPDVHSCWIRSNVITEWVQKTFPDRKGNAIQFVKNLSKTGYLPSINCDWQTYPKRGNERRRGVLWMNDTQSQEVVYIIAKNGNKVSRMLTEASPETDVD